MTNRIVILGSANIDHIAKVSRLPVPGETIGDAIYSKAFGGKGFNQAVAAARAGGDVIFLANVGDDEDGRQIIQAIRNEGADTGSVLFTPGTSTGTAFILVEDSGENVIAVSPGANKALSVEDIDKLRDKIAEAEFLVMQMEIPYECVNAAASIAAENGTFVLLNPAPACKISDELISKTDLLVLNETESEVITGESVHDAGIEEISRKLIHKGAKAVIITLGSSGSYYSDGRTDFRFPAFRVKAVDTTAAGDTFCGALVTFISEGMPIPASIRMASAAAALSVQKLGAFPSIPYKREIERFVINKD